MIPGWRSIDKYHIDIYQKYTRQIDDLVHTGLLEWVGEEKEQLRLTRRGRLLGNQVFMQFVGD
jgi:oxygen-independent coproporphyrinogen-3 oxidase